MRIASLAPLLAMAALVAGCGKEAASSRDRPADTVARTRLPASLRATNDIEYFIDGFTETSGGIQVDGWAYIKTLDARDSEISIVLQSPDGAQDAFRTWKAPRLDVAQHFQNPNLVDSGFSAWIPRSLLAAGEYRVGVYIRRQQREAMEYTPRMLRIN